MALVEAQFFERAQKRFNIKFKNVLFTTTFIKKIEDRILNEKN